LCRLRERFDFARPVRATSSSSDWGACSAICDESDYRMFGSFFDGKGQPSQISAVSHGSSTTRFDGINVINTARSLG
jgi:TldD protein